MTLAYATGLGSRRANIFLFADVSWTCNHLYVIQFCLRFLIGCDFDVKEARRRWDITRNWRQDDGINDILSECPVIP